MSIKNFVPTIWSARVLANLDKNLVFGSCVNRDYEGEIKEKGNTVKINRLGNITIKDYDGNNIAAPEDPTSEQVILLIDQQKYFNFSIKDVDKVQSNISLVDKYTGRAAYGMADIIDQHIASFVKDAGISVGSTSTPVTVTVANAYDSLVDLKVALNKNNVPKQGRFVVVPPEFIGFLEKDPRFTKETDVLKNGYTGKVAGFDVYESNNVVVAANKYSILAGSTMAITHAGQIVEVEAYRPENNFSDAVKGLYVYGTKVTEPKALCKFIVTFTA